MSNFEEWFDTFTDKCRGLGYMGPIDKDTFREEFEDGKSPEDSAQEFVNEMRED